MTQHVSSPRQVFEVMKEKPADDTFTEQVRHVVEQELNYRPSLMKAHNTDGEKVQRFTFFMTGTLSSTIKNSLENLYKEEGWKSVNFKEWIYNDFVNEESVDKVSRLHFIHHYAKTHVFSLTLETTLKDLIAT